MNTQYQITYLKESKEGIEVKARILEGNYQDATVMKAGVETTEKAFQDSKIIDVLKVNFKAGTKREEINKYFNDRLAEDKERTSIWK